MSTEPFKSSPLVLGYCGMLQYMLWKKELHTSVKQGENPSYEHHSSDTTKHDYGQPDVKPTIKTQAYLSKALTHFESLRQLTISESDNMNVFTILHYKVFDGVCSCSSSSKNSAPLIIEDPLLNDF